MLPQNYIIVFVHLIFVFYKKKYGILTYMRGYFKILLSQINNPTTRRCVSESINDLMNTPIFPIVNVGDVRTIWQNISTTPKNQNRLRKFKTKILLHNKISNDPK